MTAATQRRGRPRPSTVVAIAAAGLALTAAAVIAGVSSDAGWLGQQATAALSGDIDRSLSTDGSLGQILARNIGVAAFLYSGAVTAGISTVLGISLVGLGIGTSAALVHAAGGWGGLLWPVLLYAPIEFAGLIAAAAAGILPLARVLLPASELRGSGLPTRYLDGMRASLTLLSVAAGAIVLGAVIEAALIGAR